MFCEKDFFISYDSTFDILRIKFSEELQENASFDTDEVEADVYVTRDTVDNKIHCIEIHSLSSKELKHFAEFLGYIQKIRSMSCIINNARGFFLNNF
jgi:hypothetical protein